MFDPMITPIRSPEGTVEQGPAAQTATATETPTPAPMPTQTHYEELAAQIIQALDAVKASLPNLQTPHSETRNFVKGKTNVPRQFIATSIAAVEQTPALQALNKLDTVAARDSLQFSDAFKSVVDKLIGLAKALTFTMQARHAVVATGALQVYSIAKGISRDATEGETLSHVRNLKRDLARNTKPRKSKQLPTPPIVTQPATNAPMATH